MATTNFLPGQTPITADWLNDVNGATYSGTAVYQPEGVQAVATTVQTKLRESVSVLDFGADSTGAADSKTAFDNAWAQSNPQAVFVPAGTYKIVGTSVGKFYSLGTVTITTGYVTTITNLVP